MNGYKCFYRHKTMEVHAETTRAAQLKAAALWKVKAAKAYQVTAMLCELEHSGDCASLDCTYDPRPCNCGAQVVHAAID